MTDTDIFDGLANLVDRNLLASILRDDHQKRGKLIAERDALREEVRYLRQYGNKDCTAMADEARKNREMGDEKPVRAKIYGFFNSTDPSRDAEGIAVDEQGAVLATHISSNESWSALDLPGHTEDFDKAHPEGWDFEFVTTDKRDNHLGLQAALAANRNQPTIKE